MWLQAPIPFGLRWLASSLAPMLAAEGKGGKGGTISSTCRGPTRISAVVTRFFSPPDTPRSTALPTTVSAHRDSPSSLMISSTLQHPLRILV